MDDGRKVITIAHPEQSSGELKTLVLIIAPIPKGNPSLQTSNEINASLQKLLRGNNIFTLYFTPKTKTKLKKGHNLAKILQMITNIELDLYFTMIYLLQTFNKTNASLQKLLSGNQYQHTNKK